MLAVQINDTEMKQLCLQKIEEKLNEIGLELVYWDAKELKRRCRLYEIINLGARSYFCSPCPPSPL